MHFIIFTFVALLSLARGYYVPGTYPREFKSGDQLSGRTNKLGFERAHLSRAQSITSNAVNVNSLKSFDTELPFEYYTMPFCQPPEGIKRIADTTNPGTILEGLRIENSPYNFTVKVLGVCMQLLCISIAPFKKWVSQYGIV